MESLAVASHPLQDLNRQGGSGEPPLPKIISSKEKRREDLHLPALFSVSGGNCLWCYLVPTVKVMKEPSTKLIWNV